MGNNNNNNDLETIFTKWADHVAKQYGTKVKWVDLDASEKDMKDYQDKKVDVRYVSTEYGVDEPTPQPGYTYSETFHNYGSVTQQSLFSDEETVTDTFSWSLTEGVKAGITVKAEVGVPGEMSASSTVTTELSLSSTQQSTESDAHTYSIQQIISVPRRTTVVATWVINEDVHDLPFESSIEVTGYGAVWFKDKIDFKNPGGKDKHWLWFPQIGTVIADCKSWGIATDSFEYKNSKKITGKATGVFTGVAGSNGVITVKEYPLQADGSTPDANVAATSVSEIAIAHSDALIKMGSEGVGPQAHSEAAPARP